MSELFEPYQLGPLEIKNRFIRSATTSYWSDEEGKIRPEIVDLYKNLANGGVGLIIKGHLYITESGKAHTGMAGISNDQHVVGLRTLTQSVHSHGGKIIAQLNHAGIHSIQDRAGPSKYKSGDWAARALSVDEINGIVKSFGEAAERSVKAGFDGVQIHGAHGYLISQFLSKQVNRRRDEYGGNLDNRMRLLLEVYTEIRERVGNNVPVMLKMNCDDFSPNGFTIRDSTKVAQSITGLGLDCLEISGGGAGRVEDLTERARSTDPELSEATFSGYAQKIRQVTGKSSLSLVNRIRTRQCMEAIIRKDVADLISMSRPFIREPDLVNHLKAGQPCAACTTCNACRSEKV
ncbi:NADH:flavin oxidoreductase, partial [Candidatus Bathyarchaeota archaeon]|nr:NADH:flavin oxidoreductase [Candidatus Bathyarchaeota archaeon]